MPDLIFAWLINYGAAARLSTPWSPHRRRLCARAFIDPASLDEATIEAKLYTAGMPDPDLLIRTAGEMRFSNYLLWQISYAEFWVTETCWPEFREPQLHAAICDYAARNRKFGGLNPADLLA